MNRQTLGGSSGGSVRFGGPTGCAGEHSASRVVPLRQTRIPIRSANRAYLVSILALYLSNFIRFTLKILFIHFTISKEPFPIFNFPR